MIAAGPGSPGSGAGVDGLTDTDVLQVRLLYNMVLDVMLLIGVTVRHIVGILIGAAVTPLLLYGGGLGFAAALDASKFYPPDISSAAPYIALMALLGLIVGLLFSATRLSPFAILLPSIAFVVLTVGYLLRGFEFLHWMPKGPGMAWQGMYTLVATGTFGFLGGAMLVNSLAPSRWRTRPSMSSAESVNPTR